jgi:hypothetical protein
MSAGKSLFLLPEGDGLSIQPTPLSETVSDIALGRAILGDNLENTEELPPEEIAQIVEALHEANDAADRVIGQLNINTQLLDSCINEMQTIRGILHWSNQFALAKAKVIAE